MDKKLIYDVGMHKGEDTSYYLAKGFNVIAFEADPELLSFCKKKFQKEIESKQLVIVEGAIAYKGETGEDHIKFYKNNNDSAWGTVVEKWSLRNEKLGAPSSVIEVPRIDFKECLKYFGIPYYLKIDIEGMDLICLKALSDFNKKPEYVSIESEKINFSSLKKEFKLFQELGYCQYNVVNQANIHKQKEPMDSKEGKFVDWNFQPGASGLFGSDLQRGWLNQEQALKKYRWIFLGYKLWGDNSKIKKWRVVDIIRRIIRRFIVRQEIPGWFDTHAKYCGSSKL